MRPSITCNHRTRPLPFIVNRRAPVFQIPIRSLPRRNGNSKWHGGLRGHRHRIPFRRPSGIGPGYQTRPLPGRTSGAFGRGKPQGCHRTSPASPCSLTLLLAKPRLVGMMEGEVRALARKGSAHADPASFRPPPLMANPSDPKNQQKVTAGHGVRKKDVKK